MQSLAPGKYELNLIFSGEQAIVRTTFVVQQPIEPSPTPSATSPATGDTSSMMLFVMVGAIAVAGIVSIIIYRNRRTVGDN